MKKNKFMKIYIIIASFIIGVVLTVFTYQAITIYQLRTIVSQDHNTVVQIVDFLNKSMQGSQTQQSSTPASNPAPAKK